MEPMFAGIPILTFNVGTASSLVRDFTTGFVVKDKSEKESFVRKLEFLITNDDERTKMGRNAKQFANDWLTWHRTAENTISMWDAV
jgi:glycosyltransferase involved in cell wall biosynthesis